MLGGKTCEKAKLSKSEEQCESYEISMFRDHSMRTYDVCKNKLWSDRLHKNNLLVRNCFAYSLIIQYLLILLNEFYIFCYKTKKGHFLKKSVFFCYAVYSKNNEAMYLCEITITNKIWKKAIGKIITKTKKLATRLTIWSVDISDNIFIFSFEAYIYETSNHIRY